MAELNRLAELWFELAPDGDEELIKIRLGLPFTCPKCGKKHRKMKAATRCLNGAWCIGPLKLGIHLGRSIRHLARKYNSYPNSWIYKELDKKEISWDNWRKHVLLMANTWVGQYVYNVESGYNYPQTIYDFFPERTKERRRSYHLCVEQGTGIGLREVVRCTPDLYDEWKTRYNIEQSIKWRLERGQ